MHNQTPLIIQRYLEVADEYCKSPTEELISLRHYMRQIKDFIVTENKRDFNKVPPYAYSSCIPYLTYGRSMGHTLAVGRYLVANKDKTVLVLTPQRGLYTSSANLIVTSPAKGLEVLRQQPKVDKIIFDSVSLTDLETMLAKCNPIYLSKMVRVGS